MKVSLKLKNANIDKLLGELVVLIDTREQKNQHITNYFDKKGIKYKVQKLDYGDYSCMLPKNESLGLPFDITLENVIAIEKKNSLEEVAGNLTNGRQAFENEFIRSQKCKRFVLLIENGSWDKIRKKQYEHDFGNKAFYNSLLSWSEKYNFRIDFVEREATALHILEIFKLALKHCLEE